MYMEYKPVVLERSVLSKFLGGKLMCTLSEDGVSIVSPHVCAGVVYFWTSRVLPCIVCCCAECYCGWHVQRT